MRERYTVTRGANRLARGAFVRLMVLVLALGLVVGVGTPAIAKTADGDTVLAFTSDVHNKSGNEGRDRLDSWVDTMSTQIGHFEYMGFCGDMADAQVNESTFWSLADRVFTLMDGKADKVDVVRYTTGNHEFSPGNWTLNKNDQTKRYTVGAEGANGDNYRVYCLGCTSGTQQYTQDQVSALSSYLSGCGTDKPIFVMTHFPLHYLQRGNRSTGNAKAVIDALNAAADEGKTIIFLWGHNHSQSDPQYDNFYMPGGSITYANGSSSEIKFTYCAAGCMSDTEYTGSSSVKGKGLIITVDKDTKAVHFAYYGVGNALVAEKEITPNYDAAYTITWVNDDGTTLKTSQVAEGETPAYEGGVPTKEATAEYSYTFAGWTPNIVAASADATYKATYTAAKRTYTVAFVDEDGSELKVPKQYEYGTKASEIDKPVTPTKPADDTNTYRFAGWDPEIADVTGDATYKATYTARPLSEGAKWERLSGTGRYDTMSAIVSAGFKKSTVAVLATGKDYPDALVAASVAGALECPIILTQPAELSQQAATQLENLDVEEVYVIGGESAVSKTIWTQLEGMDIVTHRISGSSRLGTSLESMKTIKKLGKFDGTAVIATGYNFADALSIGPWCYKTATPILLANKAGKLSDAEVEAAKELGVKSIIIVGGTGAVSNEVFSQLNIDEEDSGSARLAGKNRYETSRDIAIWELAERGMTMANVAVSTGAKFPDALAGAALCGHNNSVLILAKDEKSAGLGLINANSGVETGYALGGASAVSDSLFAHLQALTA